MKSGLSQSVTTTAQVKATISEWIQESKEFHCNHSKISAILQDRYGSTYSTSTLAPSANKQCRIRSLNKLREYMNHVLETLMTDMDNYSHGAQHTDNSDTLSRVGNLSTHTRLLKETNRKINKELILLNAFQA